MARPIRPWFRFYVEAFPDRKIRRLKPAHRWVWVSVLGAARESPEPGHLFVAPGLAMTTEELADYAAVSVREVVIAIDAMINLSMVTVNGNGLISVTNWDKRQFESDDVTKRTQTHRERSKEQDRNVPGNAPERGRAFATETEAETEAKTDTTTSSEVADAPIRPDVEELLDLLDEEMHRNGAKVRPRIKRNAEAIRLLIDRDNRSTGEIADVIRWCQANEFWRTNILSASKLREKYDQLRMRMNEQPRLASVPSQPWTPPPGSIASYVEM